jgi:hypothetical protein
MSESQNQPLQLSFKRNALRCHSKGRWCPELVTRKWKVRDVETVAFLTDSTQFLSEKSP